MFLPNIASWHSFLLWYQFLGPTVTQLIRPVLFTLQTVVVQASHVKPLEDFDLDRLHGRGRGGQDHHCLTGLIWGHHLPHHRGMSQHLSLRTMAWGVSLWHWWGLHHWWVYGAVARWHSGTVTRWLDLRTLKLREPDLKSCGARLSLSQLHSYCTTLVHSALRMSTWL